LIELQIHFGMFLIDLKKLYLRRKKKFSKRN
jgi:hypothetical protein